MLGFNPVAAAPIAAIPTAIVPPPPSGTGLFFITRARTPRKVIRLP